MMAKIAILVALGLALSACAAEKKDPQVAATGGVDGGGGVGVRCVSPDGSSTLELLDLHEARLSGITIGHQPQTKEEAADLVANLLSSHYWNHDTIPLPEMKKSLAKSLLPLLEMRPFEGKDSPMSKVEIKETLPLSGDVGHYTIQKGCHLEQIAYTDDTTRTIRYATKAWNDLSWLHRSALIFHEFIYFIQRTESLERLGMASVGLTSERARRFAGLIYSVGGLRPKAYSVPSTNLGRCWDTKNSSPTDTYFYYFKNAEGKVTTVFNVLYGLTSTYQVKATFSNVASEALEDFENGEIGDATPIEFTDAVDTPKFILKLRKGKGQLPSFRYLMLKDRKPWGRLRRWIVEFRGAGDLPQFTL
jgi:hypothetical protein